MNLVLRGSGREAVILKVKEVALLLGHCKFLSEISFLTAEIRLKGTFCLNMFTTGQLDSAWTRTLMSTIPGLSQRKIWFLLLNCIENVKKNREWLNLDLILFIHLFKAVALEPVLLLDHPNRGPEQELAHSWQEAVNV